MGGVDEVMGHGLRHVLGAYGEIGGKWAALILHVILFLSLPIPLLPLLLLINIGGRKERRWEQQQ